MKILDVIPISRGIGVEILQYFSSDDIAPGAMVLVPLKSKRVPALVIESHPAEAHKSELRSQGFMLKKIASGSAQQVLSEAFLKTSKRMSNYTVASTGSVLASMVPKVIYDNYKNLPKKIGHKKRLNDRYHKFILQADDEERIAHYKSLIRESFARNASVFFCLPTTHDIERIRVFLERGIEEFTYILHSGISKKEILSLWKKIITEEHPVLIIGTGSFLAIPREDIGTIIIENEGSRAYKTLKRPFIDIRTFAEFLSEEMRANLVFGDMVMRVETISRYHDGELGEIAPPKFRSLSSAQSEIIDMRPLDQKEGFSLISGKLAELITHTKEHNEHLFILVSRKGFAPITVCGDCGTTHTCEHCDTPVVLYQRPRENIFLCHHCGRSWSSRVTCRTCDGWKLEPLGIGIELVEETLKEWFPQVALFRIDGDTTTTSKKINEEMEKFFNAPGSILLGTEMAISHISHTLENTAVVSLDSLFAIPDFRMNERVFRIIIKLRSITQRSFILQTRQRAHAVLDHALRGNMIDFYRAEEEMRKQFNYPPFSLLIKISTPGTPEDLDSLKQKIETWINPESIEMFSGMRNEKGKGMITILLRIPHQEIKETDIFSLLKELPPYYTINVDPQNLR